MDHVLIIGGTSGIGYELARCFAQNGYKIVIASSSRERLETTKSTLEKEYKVPIHIYEQDLAEIGAATELYQKIKSDGINIGVLVNNAGYGLIGATEAIDSEQEKRMIILNVINLVELCKLFIANMYSMGRGKILNTASIGAFQPGPYSSTYFASKAFVLSYSRAIRYEAKKRGVHVCAVCPGTTKTDFFNKEGVKTPSYALSAERVAKTAYRQLMNNKEKSIPGFVIRVMHLFPTKIKMSFVAKLKG